MTARFDAIIHTFAVNGEDHMVDRIIERTETEAPREPVVIHEDREPHSSNTGLIIAIIVIVLLLLFFFGGSLFGGGGGGSTPTNNTNIQTPSPSQGQ